MNEQINGLPNNQCERVFYKITVPAECAPCVHVGCSPLRAMVVPRTPPMHGERKSPPTFSFLLFFMSHAFFTPILALSSANFALPKAFLRMSAIWYSVFTCLMKTIPSLTQSRMKWYYVSMCLVLLWWAEVLLNIMVDWLSTIIFTTSISTPITSFTDLAIHTP